MPEPQNATPAERPNGQTLAAIDLGSNSFHMIVARAVDGQLTIVDRLREMVQLGAGLDATRRLTPEVQQRALECLERFGQRVRTLPQGSVRVVGTNTLRVARNAWEFLEKAEAALGHPIEIISGIEEARLIYAGVVHGLGPKEERRLVVDIGGGSTELIIGERFLPLDMESLYIGCVTMTARYFADGKISGKRFRKAEVTALQELERVQKRFRKLGWSVAIGASGTIKTVDAIVTQEGWSQRGITPDALKKLSSAIRDSASVDDLSFKGLSRSRAPALPGGVAVLSAIFECLEIDEMHVSEGALREGLLNDLLGRFLDKDVRTATVESLMDRYRVDREQARRVEATLRSLLPQVLAAWNLPERRSFELSSWAARLHEIGLDIAHSQYHKHGAYVLENADMPGFSRQEQRLLAALVRAHRRKFPSSTFKSLPANARIAEHLAVLLRLSVLLHRSRTDVANVALSPSKRALEIRFPTGWLDAHPLTLADLQEESEFLRAADFELRTVHPMVAAGNAS